MYSSPAVNNVKTLGLPGQSTQKTSSAAVPGQVNGASFAAVVNKVIAQEESKNIQPTVASSETAGTKATPAKNNNAFFYGYNGKAYSLAPPTGDSFLASNGQTYTKQQVKDFFARNPNPGDDIAEMAKLGLKFPDLYKARAMVGQGNGTGIYTDPKEMAPYHDYLRSAMAQAGGASSCMGFDQWRNNQTSEYLASLQTGPIDNIGWINGPAGGVAVGGSGSPKSGTA